MKGSHEDGLVIVEVQSPSAFGKRIYFGSTKSLNNPKMTEGMPVSVPIGFEMQTPRIVGYVAATASTIQVSRWPPYRRTDTSLSIAVGGQSVASFPFTEADLVDPEFETYEPAIEIRVDTPGKPGQAAALHLYHKCMGSQPRNSQVDDDGYSPGYWIPQDRHRKLVAAICELRLDTGKVPTMKAVAQLLDITPQSVTNHAVHVITELGLTDDPDRRVGVIFDAIGTHPQIGQWQDRYFSNRA